MSLSKDDIKKIKDLSGLDSDDLNSGGLLDDLDLSDLDFGTDELFDELTSHDKNDVIIEIEDTEEDEGVEYEPI